MWPCQGVQMSTISWHSVQLVVTVLMVVLSSIHPVDSQNCPTEKHTTLPENTPVGSVIFNITLSADVNVTINYKSSRDQGYLSLRYVSSTLAQVVLEKTLDLLQLNRQTYPKPTSDENITCPAENTTDVLPLPTKKDIVYTMTCHVQLPIGPVASESSIILAIEDINDNAPFFMCSPYYKTINELTPVGTTVFTMSGLAADRDIGDGIYSFDIVSGSEGKFTMSGGGTDGYIVVTDELDFDQRKTQYVLNITVKDLGDPPLSNWTYLYISLSDGDDLNPVFTDNVYTLSLPERNNSITNKKFITTPPILAYDQDRGINNSVVYSFESGHIQYGITYFDIDSTTGAVIPLHALDSSNISKFDIKLKAHEVGKELSRTAYSTLVIKVLDVNDNRPQMAHMYYTASIPENSPNGYLVLQVSATDKDDGINAEFEFLMVDSSGVFSINRQSGEIRVKDTSLLDHETQASFNLTVYAQETKTAEKYRSDNASVMVGLIDINDNSPKFQPSAMYHFFVNKAVNSGTVIGTVFANDSDASSNGEVRYKLLFATANGLTKFQINQTNGAIYTTAALEEPYVKSYVLTVQAEDQSDIVSHRRSSVAGVTVNVTSGNENPPVFRGEPYSAHISEASPAGTTVISIVAEDVDSDEALSFHILDEQSRSYFECRPNSVIRNSVHVITLKKLDRENTSHYRVLLGVSDGHYMVNTTVNITVLDENDNNPRFLQDIYSFSIVEEQDAGVVIGTVNATDADDGRNAVVNYSIKDAWVRTFFSINSTTGEISSTQPIDREKWPSLLMEVIATDNGEHSRTGLTIVNISVVDINDHAPEFVDEPYVVSLPERSHPQSFFAVKTTDADFAENAVTRYAIISGNTSLFMIDSVTGMLSTRVEIDVTEPSAPIHYNLTVLAFNIRPYEGPDQTSLSNTTTSVIINIQDVNDNVPVFSMDVYHITMPENQTVGRSVLRVKATDVDHTVENSRLTYWLSGGDDISSFKIDKDTGVITLWDMVDRDPPSNKTYCSLQVTASNLVPNHRNQSVIHNATCTVNITVLDVNDNFPVFTKDVYEVSVYENATVQSVVFSGIKAMDFDQDSNGEVSYFMSKENIPFVIEKETGTLLLNESLDYESGKTSYVLPVTARDGGQPAKYSSAEVHVSILNLNDNNPVFSNNNYTFSVEENKPENAYIGVTMATDADGNKIAYHIDDKVSEFFRIDSDGVLSTKRKLDHEANSSFVFNVTAQDGDVGGVTHIVPVLVTVTVIDVNDNIPKFTSSLYNASVNEGQVQHVIRVNAEDIDSGVNGLVTYSIVSGNDMAIFRINQTSGDIYVEKPELLDFLTASEQILTVQAQDGGDPVLRSLANVRVTVNDINNHAPVFSQQLYLVGVPENRPPKAFVAKVTAVDKDTRDILQFSIVDENENFHIDNITGIVSTKSSLDRENTASYTLNISVYDGLNRAYSVMNIDVLDINDNSPQFTQEEFSRSIGQDTPIGKSVLKVSATDKDFSNNGTVTHWISGTDGKFMIDFNTGVIKVAGKLDYTIRSTYRMQVFARDLGWPVSLVSNVTVTININDTNTHPPEFIKFAHDANVTEDVPVNTTVVTVLVVDEDDGVAGMTDLSIISGNEDNTFNIQSDGAIKLNKTLDFEKKKYYELVVEAKDRAEASLTSTTKVRISVIDVNDNEPLFVTSPRQIFLKNPIDISTVIFQFVATDADSSLNGNNNVTYSLLTAGVPFEVEFSSGELKTNAHVQTESYPLAILASDQGIPKLSKRLNFTVYVIDSSTSRIPVFSPRFYTGTNDVTLSTSQFIADVDATVGTLSKDQGVAYNISGGLGMEYYQMNSSTGMITTTKPVSSSELRIHLLIILAVNLADTSYYSQTGAVIHLKLNSANLHAPYFPFTEYAAEISENSLVDTTVITLTAQDEDVNAVLLYSVIEDNSGQSFRVLNKDNTAVITVLRSPDREAMSVDINNIYTLKIAVTDGMHQVTTSLVIKIKDVNDNAPSFPIMQYNATSSEDVGPCEEIVQVQATDLDLVDQRQLSYSIVDGNSENKFRISNTSGMISRNCDVAGQLDRETTDEYLLVIRVEDSLLNNATTQVHVRVTDVNDEPPKFEGAPYEATVYEGNASLLLKLPISVTDKDIGPNGLVKLDIADGNSAEEFNITSMSTEGKTEGTLHVLKPLNREKPGVEIVNGTAVYKVVVIATDEGRPPLSASTTITIYVTDINDNPPEFERSVYVQSISEGTPVGTPVTTIRAKDKDLLQNTNMTYSLDAEGNNGMFSIGIYSGEIVVVKKLAITKQPNYNLTVRASDGLFSSKASLQILLVDINDHSPTFSQPVYYFNAMENNLSGVKNQVVGIVTATDLDYGINGEMTFAITSRNAIGRFAIQNATEGTITVIGTLDREVDDKYTLIVMATDKGIPSRMGTCEVEVSILDVNDNKPEFVDAPYTGTVAEHSPTGTTVMILERKKKFPPIKATDQDIGLNAVIQYSLAGVGSDLFHVDPVSGVVSVKTDNAAQLDREAQNSYNLQVIAVDRNGTSLSLSSSTSLTITLTDINDHAPKFVSSHYQFNVSESSPPNFFIGRLQAEDYDIEPNNRTQYSVTGGSDAKFYIDKLTGDLYVTGGLDRELKNEYVIQVTAQDGGVYPGPLEGHTNVTVTITDANDNYPVFKDNPVTFKLAENSGAGFVVGTVEATDGDLGMNGKIRYFMNETVPFKVDEGLGEISTTEDLNREEQSEYIFTLYASDYGNPPLVSMATVTSIILDENDNKPKFEQDVYNVNILEKQPIDSVIALTRAFDLDQGKNANITYTLQGRNGSEKYFRIDPTAGLVRISKSIDKTKLIMEGILSDGNSSKDSTMELKLFGADAGSPVLTGQASLFIKVDEINDDNPVFTNVTYSVLLTEESPPGSSVVQVKATTKDPSTEISYAVLNTDEFTMNDHISGKIVTATKRLDRETRDRYSFTVQAVDNRIPQRTAFTTVSVLLTDINDNTPSFMKSEYHFRVNESSYLNHTVGIVTATDGDDGTNKQLEYSILSGNKDALFSVGGDGRISVSGNLDREDTDEYILTVKVKDMGEKLLTSSCVVRISVLDENDQSPVFLNAPYQAAVQENLSPGQQVVIISASDADSGLNGAVFMDIVSENSSSLPFYIQNKGAYGIVRTLTSLDYEEVTSYNLTVIASDLGSPSRSSYTFVNITVIDVMDSQPQFGSELYEVEKSETTPVGALIINLNAGSGEYIYNITEGNPNGIFSLNHTSGSIYLAKPLSMNTRLHELTIVACDYKVPPNKAKTKVRVIVTSSSPKPKFEKPVYTLTYEENQSAPRMLLDLNTNDELLSVPVTYSIISGDENGKFSIEASSGKLWCNEELDREAQARYIVRVQCDFVTNQVKSNRRRRAAETTNVAEVIVNVGDVNDNAPYFSVSPITAGVTSEASFNSYITTVQAYDADVGNNSALWYVITGGSDKDSFYINSLSGQLYSQTNIGKAQKKQFDIRVNATDNWGQGHTAITEVKIVVLSDSERVILVATISPTDFKMRQELIRNLSSILGWQVHAEKIEAHVENTDSGPAVDISRTDFYFYAIDTQRSSIVPRDLVLQKMQQKAKEIEALFKLYNIDEVKGVMKTETYSVSATTVALLIIACVIFFGAILAVFVVCYSWKQRERERKRSELLFRNIQRHGSLNPLQLTNPLFVESEQLATENGQPLQFDAATLSVFEVDTVEENKLPGLEETTVKSEFLSFDETGQTVIVTHNKAVPSAGQGEDQDSWVLPYDGDVPVHRQKCSVVRNGVIRTINLPGMINEESTDEPDIKRESDNRDAKMNGIAVKLKDESFIDNNDKAILITPLSKERYIKTDYEGRTVYTSPCQARRSFCFAQNDGKHDYFLRLNQYEIGETEL